MNKVQFFTVFAMAMSLRAGGHQSLEPAYGKLPLAFEENRGQAAPGVKYLARSRGGVILLRPEGAALELDDGKIVALRFAGSTPKAPKGENKLPGITSYLTGDRDQWIRGISNYGSVRYLSVYPGIDAVFHGNQKHVEYDFVLTPGADPNDIRIAFDGVDRIGIDHEGNLELHSEHRTVKQWKPKIWQTGPHGSQEVAGRYVLSGAAEARFEVDQYDRRNTLVIDPVIEYSSYFGSNRDDRALAVATDSTGAAYIAGTTATGGISWGFLSKLNPAGTAVVYTAFLGSGTCNAEARGIAVDSAANAIVTGYYTQKDTAGACNIKQVLGGKINPAGDAYVYQLVWGGNQDYGNAVAVDAAGNAYFTGSTNGNFPTTPGAISPTGWFGKDAFITKLNPAGTPIYSTYLGGGMVDEGLAIAVDTTGNAYVAGSTGSGNFPVTANAVQAVMPNPIGTSFITKVNSTATQVLYSTFLGGSSAEKVYGIAVSAQGKIHVTGNTKSPDFPTTTSAFDRTCGADGACNSTEDAYYSNIDPLKAGTTGIVYSTFLGGSGRDFGEAIAIDKNGHVWITGRTTSSADFPKVQPTQPAIGGNYDAFIAEIDPARAGGASLIYSTFLGGSLYEEGAAIDVDSLGNIYVAGYTGSTNFPVVDAVQPQTAGGNEGFIVKIAAPTTPASVALNPATVTGGANSTGTVTLTTAAPAGGAVVTLTSSNANAATVPASVTVAAGANTATFTITTKTITAGTLATISTTYNGVSKSIGLVVNPLLLSMTLNPSVLSGGSNSTGTVTLSSPAPAGGAVVTLTSANVNVAAVPASVAVAEGAKNRTFTITTKPVTTVTSLNITAMNAGASRIVTLVVNPQSTSVTLAPATVTGGSGSTGTVTLATAAPAGGAVVTLTSSNTNAATVPVSITVPGGAKTATFAVTTKPVTVTSAVTITATYGGVSNAATLTVNPPAAMTLTLNPTAVAGGVGSTGTVTLGAAAPAGGAVVTLASNNINAATVPVSTTVAAGAKTANFAITTKAVTAAATVTITATYNGVDKTATLAVNPPGVAALAGVTMNPAIMIFGSTSTGTVTLTAPAPVGGAVVGLSSSDWVSFYLPASVTVPAGGTSAQFTVGTAIGKSTTVITASYKGVNKTANLTSVNPTVQALACTPNPVIAGKTTICTVTMNGIMPGATTVWISSDQPFFAPANGTVNVPAGGATAAFSITTTLVPDKIVAHISANALATATVTMPLTINLTDRGKKWVLNNVVLNDGGKASGYFTYDAATGKYLDANILVTPGPDPLNPLGRPPQNSYYYPWPNGFHTWVNDWSTPSVLSMQNPIGGATTPPSWTLLQLNFAQPLTNAGGTVTLVTNPNVNFTPHCTVNPGPSCTPPPGNISQELFALPPLPGYSAGSWYYRVIVSGTITAQ